MQKNKQHFWLVLNELLFNRFHTALPFPQKPVLKPGLKTPDKVKKNHDPSQPIPAVGHYSPKAGANTEDTGGFTRFPSAPRLPRPGNSRERRANPGPEPGPDPSGPAHLRRPARTAPAHAVGWAVLPD